MTGYSVRLVKVFENELPGPAEFMGSRWGKWLRNYFYLVIVQNSERTVVINSGPPKDLSIPNQFQKQFAERSVPIRTDDEIMPKPLQNAGIEPSNVSLLILTPFTCYTTGNISSFTNAQICLLRRGWIDFMAPEPYSPQLPREIFIPSEQLAWLVTSGWSQVKLLEDEDEIAPGIRSWFAGAHHRSTMAVEIDTEKGTVIYTDAFFRYANIEENIPIGVCENQEEVFRTYDRVRKRAHIILPAIDPDVFKQHPDGVVA